MVITFVLFPNPISMRSLRELIPNNVQIDKFKLTPMHHLGYPDYC